MTGITIKTLNGGEVNLGAETLDSFAASLRGELIAPDEPSYDEVRSIWNAMVDRRMSYAPGFDEIFFRL